MKIVFSLFLLLNVNQHAFASSYHVRDVEGDSVISSTNMNIKNDTQPLITHKISFEQIPPNQLWEVISGEEGLQTLENYLSLPTSDANLVDHKGRSLLEMVSYLGGELGERLAARLIKSGAHTTHIDKKGHHALYMASSQGHAAIVALLLERLIINPSRLAAIINHADPERHTSLHLASSKGHDTIVKQLLVHHAAVDQEDAVGRTALHLTCYKGHESTARILIGYGADVLHPSHAGLTARQYTLMGALNTSTNQKLLVDYLSDTECKVQQNRDKEGRVRLKEYKNLTIFYETFSNKMAGIFLAYKVLHTGLITRNKDAFTVSNAINLLGNSISLPGANMISSILAKGAEAYEEAHEVKTYIKPLATFFIHTADMENTVERNAYELTCRYENQIKALTVKGAEDLAACGIGRFIKYVRDNPLKKESVSDFVGYVFEGVRIVKAHQGLLPWMDVRIETYDQTLNWTDRFIYQECTSHKVEGEDNEVSTYQSIDARMPQLTNAARQTPKSKAVAEVAQVQPSTQRTPGCKIQ